MPPDASGAFAERSTIGIGVSENINASAFAENVSVSVPCVTMMPSYFFSFSAVRIAPAISRKTSGVMFSLRISAAGRITMSSLPSVAESKAFFSSMSAASDTFVTPSVTAEPIVPPVVISAIFIPSPCIFLSAAHMITQNTLT